MFKYIKYIYEIYENQSFSKAAKKLYISQPALSSIIKKAEDELQLPIFDRSTNPISLTKAGEYYIAAIKEIIEIENRVKYKFKELRTSIEDSFSIGGSTFFCTHVLPNLVDAFTDLYSNYSIKVIEANADELSKCLKSDIVDLIIDVEILDLSIFNSIKWASENIILAVPTQFDINKKLQEYKLSFEQIKTGEYLKEKYKSVNLKYFKDEPFIFLKNRNDMYSRGLRMCKKANYSPNIIMYMDQLLTSYYVSKLGNGISFIRDTITKYEDPTDKLVFYKIDDIEATRDIMLYYKKNIKLSEVTKKFISFITNNIS